ncbi:MAG TPA: xanthine dehydrogenase family protein molybdopterin-binding subunit [Stellaceae bacterium]|nr:xanthine dehydrogenase family protein molybdopterin-binding subunit [Stellaceae bacterium]
MYVGQALRRREDVRFLAGDGKFVDDIAVPAGAALAFLRSPHAHARIRGIDTRRARAIPGVLIIVTAADWAAAGLGKLVCVHPMPFGDGRPMNEALRPAIASGKVRHVGDVVAAVVAENRYIALDAADAIAVDYEPLPAVADTAAALAADAPLLHEELGTNLVNDNRRGDAEAARAAFAQAAHVTELTLVSNRVAGSPLEPRSYVAEYMKDGDSVTLWATTQVPHMLRRWICKYALKIPETKLRVIAPDVGGGFGQKVNFTVEVATVVWLARALRRTVKWTATRSESLLSDTQARDHVTQARMAFDKDGKILAMEVDTIACLGAYLSNFAPSIPGNSYPQTITGLYLTPALDFRVRCVYTNTVPIDAYRGSGRPEATFVNERLLENGAREMGIDPVEIRRRNLIPAARFPYRALGGRTYDSGDPPALLEKLVALADYAALRREQARLRARGVLMGIGIAAFLDKSGTGPSAQLATKGGLHGGYESATIRVHSDGKVTVYSGSHSHGQGHDITFAQIAADRLGLPVEDIAIIEGDTSQVPYGNGTWGSRSASVGGTAIYRASERIVEKARRIAAHALECEAAAVSYDDGYFSAPASNRRLSFADVADLAYHGAQIPVGDGVEPGLECTIFYDPPDLNDPEAMHLAVVIVDPRTGQFALKAYYTVDDCGTVINPMIVEGQVHGGLAQGIGQAMMEHVVYDRESGQLLSGTFMDYAMPRAADMPPLASAYHCTPAPSNPLGVKGGSETGAIGPPAAIGNAVVDALWHLGVRHVELPITPYSVWRALAAARKAAA